MLNSITGKQIMFALVKQLLWHFFIGTSIVVIDAPTLFETKKLVPVCHKVPCVPVVWSFDSIIFIDRKVLVVTVSPTTQLNRLMSRVSNLFHQRCSVARSITSLPYFRMPKDKRMPGSGSLRKCHWPKRKHWLIM